MDSKQAPLHKIIRDYIINEIMRGTYEAGSMLPKQEVLAEQFGVSRTTVRKAVDDLSERGVLMAVKGKGTYVCQYKRDRHRLERSLSYSDAAHLKKSLTSKLIDLRIIEAQRGVAKQLGILPGDSVWVIERLRIVNAVAENYQITHLNHSLVRHIDFRSEDMEQRSLFDLLAQKAGLIPAYHDEEIRAVRCPAKVAKHLRIEENDPVLLIFRTVYTEDNVPMEYCEDYECTDVKGLKITTRSRPQKE